MWSLRVRSLAMVLAPMVAGCGIAHHQLSLRFSGIVRDDIDRPVNGAAVTVLSPLPVSGEDALTDLPPPSSRSFCPPIAATIVLGTMR